MKKVRELINKNPDEKALASINNETLATQPRVSHYLPSIDIDTSGESTRIARNGMLYGVLLFAGFYVYGI